MTAVNRYVVEHSGDRPCPRPSRSPAGHPQRLLSFDVTNTYITLGPWRFTIPVKKEQAIEDMDPKWVQRQAAWQPELASA